MTTNPPVYLLRPRQGEQLLEIARELVVGRDAGADVVLQGGQISRRHARLSPRAEGLWVEDLQSTNGTFINEQRVSAGTLARHGDTLRFDTLVFTLENPSAVDTNATLFSAAPDPNATLFSAAPPPVAERPAPKPAPTPASTATTGEQVVAAKSAHTPPPSWALDGQQSVDGTQFLSGSQLQQLREPSSAPALAPDVAVPTLVGLSTPVQGVRFQLAGAKGQALNQWEIGRSEQADVRIDDASVSKNHAQIINEDARWKLIDLMSANGTYVNGVKGLTSYLSHGDTLRFGQVELQFLLGGATTGADKSARKRAANPKMSRTRLMVLSFAITAVVIGVAAVVLGLV